jgi:hypothetical protein
MSDYKIKVRHISENNITMMAEKLSRAKHVTQQIKMILDLSMAALIRRQ